MQRELGEDEAAAKEQVVQELPSLIIILLLSSVLILILMLNSYVIFVCLLTPALIHIFVDKRLNILTPALPVVPGTNLRYELLI